MPDHPTPCEPVRFGCVARAWDAHHEELLGYLRHRMGGDADAAADVLHDVFVKAMRQGRDFCRLENPRAWLFQVARNALVDSVRATRAVEPLPDDDSALPAAEPAAVAPVDALAGCLERCLAEMPPEDAQILRACELDGATVREFAEAHALGLPAAKSRLLRARQRLRAHLTRVCQVRFDPDGAVSTHVPRPAAGCCGDRGPQGNR